MTASQHIADMQHRLQKPPLSAGKSVPAPTVQQARAGYSAKVKAKAISKKKPAAKAKASSRSTKTAL